MNIINPKKTEKNFHLTFAFFAVVFMFACNKLVEVDPPITSSNGENVFSEDITAIAAITGIYANMSNAPVNTAQGRLTNIFFLTGLTGDEFELFARNDATYEQFYNNDIQSGLNTWSDVYNMIFVANSAIEALQNNRGVSESIRKYLEGEAKFIRAFSYFYLVNLYGDVPLVTSTDYASNRSLPRTPSDDIYRTIISDLTDAKELLPIDYMAGDLTSIANNMRVRPNKGSASALLARVYLYLKRYVEAEEAASTLIDNKALYDLETINSVFLKESKEAIWQLQPTGNLANFSANTREGQILIIPAQGPNSNLNPILLNRQFAESFDRRDLRYMNWIKSVDIGGSMHFYPYKYKIGREQVETMEYSMVIRLAEMYLIRAESRIQQGRIADGISDINILRRRATDTNKPEDERLPLLSTGLSKQDALLSVENERKFELFTEWGHRWLDLKRTNRIDEILMLMKPGTWQSTDKLFPIPQTDLTLNPGMTGQQNPGYN